MQHKRIQTVGRHSAAAHSVRQRRTWFAEIAFGFEDRENLAAVKLADMTISETNELIEESMQQHDQEMRALMETFVDTSEEFNVRPIRRYHQHANDEMQPVDEFGVAAPARETGFYQIGLPLMRSETAIGITYEGRMKRTLEWLNRQVLRVQRSDRNWMRRLLLTALLYDSNWTFSPQDMNEDNPDIPVKALANGDAIEYSVRGTDVLQTADHYQAQANSIGDADDPFQGIYDDLTRYTNAGRDVVCYVATDLVADIRGLSALIPKPHTRFTDWGNDTSLVNDASMTAIAMGDDVIGEHESGVLIVRWRSLPNGYMLAINTDADAPIGMREDEAQALRGLVSIDAVENSGNLFLNRFRRKAGFGALNRTAAIAYLVGAADYSAPSGYDAIPA